MMAGHFCGALSLVVLCQQDFNNKLGNSYELSILLTIGLRIILFMKELIEVLFLSRFAMEGENRKIAQSSQKDKKFPDLL